MKIKDAYVIEGPLYEGHMTEDGEVPLYFDYYIEVEDLYSKIHTYIRTFSSPWEAKKLVKEFVSKKSVISTLFIEGGVWDMYKSTMSYDEERSYYGLR
jgi:hypothetical protein